VGALRISDGDEVWQKNSLNEQRLGVANRQETFRILDDFGTNLLVPVKRGKPLVFDLKTGAAPTGEETTGPQPTEPQPVSSDDSERLLPSLLGRGNPTRVYRAE
jgi:hypothetical protein